MSVRAVSAHKNHGVSQQCERTPVLLLCAGRPGGRKGKMGRMASGCQSFLLYPSLHWGQRGLGQGQVGQKLDRASPGPTGIVVV